ncbi:MAG: hypothetical protein ACRED5_20840 [Propylenella sp.]
MYKRAKNFVRRHRPTLSLRRPPRVDPHDRLIVRPIAFRRSAFDVIDSDDVDYRRYSPAEDFRDANVAVIGMHTELLDWVIDRVPWIVWRLASAGRLALVFDRSGEGAAHDPKFTAALHALLSEKGVAFHRCLLLTQNRFYRADYDAWCRASGINRGMEIFEYDYFLSRFFHDYAERGPDVFERRLAQFESRPPERERRFISLNHSARPQRLLFLLSLMRDGLFERGFISFGGFRRSTEPAGKRKRITAEETASNLLRQPGFEDLARELVPLLPALAGRGEVFFGVGSFGTSDRLAGDFETDLYQKTWFTAVAETDMFPQPVRITEKPLKPLVNFHPFLILGNPGSLAHLRAFGFETFGGAIDEGYDDEPDPRRRFDRVYAEARRLCRLDQAELRRMEVRLRDVLIGNARHGLVEMPRIYRGSLNRALIDRIKVVASS